MKRSHMYVYCHFQKKSNIKQLLKCIEKFSFSQSCSVTLHYSWNAFACSANTNTSQALSSVSMASHASNHSNTSDGNDRLSAHVCPQCSNIMVCGDSELLEWSFHLGTSFIIWCLKVHDLFRISIFVTQLFVDRGLWANAHHSVRSQCLSSVL